MKVDYNNQRVVKQLKEVGPSQNQIQHLSPIGLFYELQIFLQTFDFALHAKHLLG